MVHGKILSLVLLSVVLTHISVRGMDKKPEKLPISIHMLCKSPNKYKGHKATIPSREKKSVLYEKNTNEKQPSKETFFIFESIFNDNINNLASCLAWQSEKLKEIQWNFIAIGMTLVEYAKSKEDEKFYSTILVLKKICDNVK